MTRTHVASMLMVLLVSGSALAADSRGIATDTATEAEANVNVTAEATMTSMPLAGARSVATISARQGAALRRDARRPLLQSLYVGSSLLQAIDVYSTMTALGSSHVEANPLMQGVVKSPVAFVALKGIITGANIFASERLWRQHHRGAAIALMAASNGLMAVVAAHNMSVVRSVR